jgi:hypothetical protein
MSYLFCLGLLGAGTVRSCYVCIVPLSVRSAIMVLLYMNPQHKQISVFYIQFTMRVFVSQLEYSVGSLCAESGEPFLSVRRKHLCGYASKLAAHIHHLPYSAFFRPAFRNHYERNTTAPRPAGLCVQQHLSDLHVTLPTVVPHKEMPVPPWLLLKATFDFSPTKYWKSTIPAELFLRHFAEVPSKYPDHTHICTDRSVIQGSTGCSFVFDSQRFIFHLHPFCSILTA